MSRAQQVSGAHFEAWVDGQHIVARNRGLLIHAEHTQAVSRMLGGKLVYAAPGVADYVLCLRGGRYVAVEAKACAGPRLYRSRIGPLQARHLDAVARGGALALLLVESRDTGASEYFAIPWTEVVWERARSADSARVESFAPWRISPGSCYLERFVNA